MKLIDPIEVQGKKYHTPLLVLEKISIPSRKDQNKKTTRQEEDKWKEVQGKSVARSVQRALQLPLDK